MAPPRQNKPDIYAIGRSYIHAVLALSTIALISLLGGFLVFTNSLALKEPNLDVKAEGVVALTGGSDRVIDAADFLSRGQAKRLLITGVNRATRTSVLEKLLPVSHELFKCCVDLGYQAIDTAGNAAETKLWAETHQLTHALIVVTSNYHMPRALLELSAALPHTTFYPYPVVSDHANVTDWWRDKRVARLVAGEYVKFIGALIRIQLDRIANDDDPQLQH